MECLSPEKEHELIELHHSIYCKLKAGHEAEALQKIRAMNDTERGWFIYEFENQEGKAEASALVAKIEAISNIK